MPTNQGQLEQTLASILREHVPQMRRLQEAPGSEGGDFVAHGKQGSIFVEIKQSKTPSIPAVIGQLAASVLRTQRFVNSTDQIPLVVAMVPRVGPKTKREVERFMSENAPQCGWGIADRSGGVRLVIPPLGVDADVEGLAGRADRTNRGSTRLFSDLNRWMLKVLLLADAPPALWNGPRGRVATPTQLHRVANVSVAKAHQFCRAFEKAGYLRRTPRGLTIVRRAALMETWFHNERARRADPIPVRSIFGPPASLHDVLVREDIPGEFAIAGFEACRLLGILHAPVAHTEVYLTGELESAIDALDLDPCDARDAHFYLRKAQFPKSILRGRLTKAELPVVDVLQAALDVCDDAARGHEQAEYVIRHVLGWKETDDGLDAE